MNNPRSFCEWQGEEMTFLIIVSFLLAAAKEMLAEEDALQIKVDDRRLELTGDGALIFCRDQKSELVCSLDELSATIWCWVASASASKIN